MRETDKEALEEYETELRLYEGELQKERELACAAEFVRRNLEDVQERASQVGYMSAAGAFDSLFMNLMTEIHASHFWCRTSELSNTGRGLAALAASGQCCRPPRHASTTVQSCLSGSV